MATTDLKLDEPGSPPRPGPIGRLVRLGFGLLCLYYVHEPAAFSAVVFGGIALFGYMTVGTVETSLLAWVVWLWELYIFSHLGLAFVIAGVISTPGWAVASD